jgi:catechol 2,3-dioxygenase-like lactoylglutathione lyase family enzyme
MRHAHVMIPAPAGRIEGEMVARINHVSVNATDLQASIAFYGELLGAEPVPTPDFGQPVQWLAVGDTHLHVFERDLQPTSHHHFAVEVDDIEQPYRMARRLGIFDDDSFGHRLIELPGDVVQLYLRDPAGNLVELDALGAGRLSDELRADLRVLADVRPQAGEHALARLPLRDDSGHE